MRYELWFLSCGLLGCAAGAAPEAATPSAVTIATEPSVSAAPAPEEAPLPPSPAPEVALVYRWDLKEVRYHDGRPSALPKRSYTLSFRERGSFGGDDGCNDFGGAYELSGENIRIMIGVTTQVECSGIAAEVDFDQVTRFKLDGHRLELLTPTQSFVFERFPYSRICEHAWALNTITELETGVVTDATRFRVDRDQLFLAVEKDATFRFLDLSLEAFTGTVEVREPEAVSFTLDASSRSRLEQREENLGPVTDNTRRSKAPPGLYPMTFAQQIDWGGIESFEVHEAPIVIQGREIVLPVLDLKAKTRLYRFEPR